MIRRPMTMEEARDMSYDASFPLVADGRGMVVENEGSVAAMLMCYNWTETSCWVHLVIRDSQVLQNQFLANELFNFTFGANGLRMLLTTASSLNEGSLALQKAYGFEELVRIPDAFSEGEDMVISRLTRETWLSKRAH